ncbi:MAG: WGR domain-containing protein [Chitinophagales bacterium]|nr:WGR domain-containing protein [Chitinophagales bacterium]
MKIIKQVKLFYFEGNSDKVYEIDLCEVGQDKFVVNFRYGRRGSTLKEGTKTSAFVDRNKAESIFSDLEKEKRQKGYQSEVEVFVELPTLDKLDNKTIKWTILKRLEDATQHTQSFKTQWKTSRVIWKAADLNIVEAIPFILKLATKGDEMQLYASMYAFKVLHATEAIGLLLSIAESKRHKSYIQNLALESLLTIGDENIVLNTLSLILDLQSKEIKYFIDTEQDELLKGHLFDKIRKEEAIETLDKLYLISKAYPSLHPILMDIVAQLPLKPPYFKPIRALYKLSKFRNDNKMLSLIAYRIEKTPYFYQRKVSLRPDAESNSQYIFPLQQYIDIRKELKSNDSRIAFSNYTKLYFQSNCIQHLNNLGKSNDAKEYLNFAVNVLLQYKETDFKPAFRKPISNYGSYDFKKRTYYFTVIDYPDCYDSYLLTTILYGNDKKRQLNNQLHFYIAKNDYESNEFYYRPETCTLIERKEKTQSSKVETPTVLSYLTNTFKGLFSKKETAEPASQPVTNVPAPENQRPEVFSHFWDQYPESYIQLLMQANMSLVLRFAFDNLRKHVQYGSVMEKIDATGILKLLYRDNNIPQEFGFEIILNQEQKLLSDDIFIAKTFYSDHKKTREWAKKAITNNFNTYSKNADFMVLLLLCPTEEEKEYISSLLHSAHILPTEKQVIVEKTIIELLAKENNASNNFVAELATQRLMNIAPETLKELSWEMIAQLLASPLENNTLLASEIILTKSEAIPSQEIPFSLIERLLKNGHPIIRQNGISLLNKYSENTLHLELKNILNNYKSHYIEVIEAINCVTQKVVAFESNGELITESLVYALIRKENFEGAHSLFKTYLTEQYARLLPQIPTKLVIKLLFSSTKEGSLTGYELLKGITDDASFTIKQVIALSNHEMLAVRQWSWNFFKNNVARIRLEREVAFNILDSDWDDTREFAFHFFNTAFNEYDWDVVTLVSLVDSIRSDVERFGRNLITQFFKPEHGLEYLTKLSEHPSINVQLFVTNYLEEFAQDNPEKLQELEFYIRSVLGKVNKARIAKKRIFAFLERESKKSEKLATIIAGILDDVSAISAIRDKARCIQILTGIQRLYPNISSHLILTN